MYPESETAKAARLREVPQDARERAEILGREHEQREREKAESEERTASRLLERARVKIRDLLGPETSRALQDLKQKERIALQERMQPPVTPDRDFVVENRARKVRVNEFLEGRGIAPSRISETVKAQFAHLRDHVYLRPSAFSEAIAIKFHAGLLEQWKGVIVQDPHRFFVFEPPFDGFQMGFGVSRSPQAYRVSVNRFVHLDLNAGLVGHTLHLDVINASDIDTARGIVDTQVDFWFQAPTAGLVEVLIEAQSGMAVHELSVSDEWGTSNSETRQNNYLMMHVLHPNVQGPSFALMSDFFAITDDSNSYNREFLTRGGDFAAQLFSDGPVAANEWVIVRAGTRSDDWTMTNDMEIHSTSRFQWFIKKIHVRIAP